MRFAFCALAALPLPVMADDITLNSRATEAIIYAQGSMVTHEVQLTAASGRHQLIFPDLPPNLPLQGIRITAGDIQLGAIRYRKDLAPARPDPESDDVKAARAAVRAAQDAVQQIEDNAARARLAQDAAKARIAFLTSLGNSDTLPDNIATLRDLAQMISDETLKATSSALDAQIAARAILKDLEQANKDLKDAQANLAALIVEPKERPYLVLNIASNVPIQDQPIRVTYFANASWQPTYDLRLSDDDTPRLTLNRGAAVFQNTGENWEDIKLSVSTQTIGEQLEPSFLHPDRRRIFDPEEIAELRTRASNGVGSIAQSAAPSPKVAGDEPIVMEAAATGSFEGLAMRYDFVSLVDIASGADSLRIPFDTIEFDAEIFARAVPLHDDTAFLMARFTNTSDEPILSTDNALRFFDGALVGAQWLEAIQAGQETELAFGPIHGLQLTHKVLARNEGDRGLISRSNELTQATQITAKNLTNRTWQLELQDRVPYSEQEELTISYTTDPTADITTLDDRRGILQWNIEMEPNTDATINTTYKITWPEGMTLH